MPNRQHRSAPTSVANDGVALVTVQGAANTQSKAQREFNRLTAQLKRARARVEDWEAWGQRYLDRMQAELLPAESALRESQRRLLLRVDAMLSDPNTLRGLSKRHCATLRGIVTDVTQDLLAHAHDAELAALHDKHSEFSLEQMRQQQLEFAQTLAASVLGDDVIEGHAAESVEDLFEHITGRVTEQAAAEQQARAARDAAKAAKRGRPTRAELDAERREQAAKAASASVREVYRKLASSLHPDRESDPAERARKTVLMQRANQAYAANDVLALLHLQLEIEQIDSAHLASVPDVRIKHYNQVLRERMAELEQQLVEFAERYADQLGVDYALCDPRAANTAFDQSLANIKAIRRNIDRDLRDLSDPRTRRALLDSLQDNESGDLMPADLNAFMSLFDSTPPAANKRRRR